eukprot:Skav202644  [mRNA]  locus=scaffold2784:20399:20779:+ [translate_table: standard]
MYKWIHSNPRSISSWKITAALMPWFRIQIRCLSRARCLGRTAREILQAEKLDRVLMPNKRQRYGRGSNGPPNVVTESQSLMHLFPRELLDWSFESLEKESKVPGKQGDRARQALKLILSRQFDQPR